MSGGEVRPSTDMTCIEMLESSKPTVPMMHTVRAPEKRASRACSGVSRSSSPQAQSIRQPARSGAQKIWSLTSSDIIKTANKKRGGRRGTLKSAKGGCWKHCQHVFLVNCKSNLLLPRIIYANVDFNPRHCRLQNCSDFHLAQNLYLCPCQCQYLRHRRPCVLRQHSW